MNQKQGRGIHINNDVTMASLVYDRREDPTIEICLNCERPKCDGRCGHFSRKRVKKCNT